MQAGWLRCPADAAVREAVIVSQSAEPHLEDGSVYHARWWPAKEHTRFRLTLPPKTVALATRVLRVMVSPSTQRNLTA